MSLNRRVFYAVHSVAIAADGTSTFTNVHGADSVGINTKFNLQQIFELGQVSIYQQVEDVPDIECTISKSLDGYPLVYHLGTYPSATASLAGRSANKVIVGMNVYSDLQNSASGTPIAQAYMSGMYCANLQYTIPTQGVAKESVTFVGNNKTWGNVFATTAFTNTDSPMAITGSGGVQRRQDILFGSGFSMLPQDIPGVQGDGFIYDATDALGTGPHIHQIRISTNLGREPLYELGHKGPYHRYVNFPVEVRCEFEVIANGGDNIQAYQEVDNLTARRIYIMMREGTVFDLSNQNKCNSVTFSGGNAAQNGGNVTVTYSFITWSDLTISHPQDPSGLWPVVHP